MDAVAIVTRTKNRTVLLRRALESVCDQTFKDLVWIIVNDGGETGPVDDIALQAAQSGVKVSVIHNPVSLGMEAASNLGVRKSDSEFVVIHDDDDSWLPTFLEKTVAFLRSEPGMRYGGVVTHSIKVEETVENNSYRIWSRFPFNRCLKAVYLSDVAKVNSFPPISFLYRRSLYERLNGYDESLPVLGDWDFNLRFLLHADIAVIPELLACYHHRIALTDSNYGNTIIHGIERHVEYDMLIRNKLLRLDVAEGRVGLGYLVNLSREFRILIDTRPSFHRIKLLLSNTVVGRYLRKVIGLRLS